ncbi:jg27080, partial [Pararge aegeria aegeria]
NETERFVTSSRLVCVLYLFGPLCVNAARRTARGAGHGEGRAAGDTAIESNRDGPCFFGKACGTWVAAPSTRHS